MAIPAKVGAAIITGMSFASPIIWVKYHETIGAEIMYVPEGK